MSEELNYHYALWRRKGLNPKPRTQSLAEFTRGHRHVTAIATARDSEGECEREILLDEPAFPAGINPQALVGAVDSQAAWRWDGNGSPRNEMGSPIVGLLVYVDWDRRWEALRAIHFGSQDAKPV